MIWIICLHLLSNFTLVSTGRAVFMMMQKRTQMPSSMVGRKSSLLLVSFLNTKTGFSWDTTKEEDIPRRKKGMKTWHCLYRSIYWSKWSRLHCSIDLYACVTVQIFLNQSSCCHLMTMFVWKMFSLKNKVNHCNITYINMLILHCINKVHKALNTWHYHGNILSKVHRAYLFLP